MVLPGIVNPGFGAQGAAAPAPPGVEISLTAQSTDNNNLGFYSFSSLSIGAEAADRRIIVTVGGRDSAGADQFIGAVSVGGITAQGIGDAAATGVVCSIFVVAVPTGTTADVTVIPTGVIDNCTVGLFRMTGASSNFAFDSSNDVIPSAGVFTRNLNIPANGGIVGVVAADRTTSGGAVTWVGVNEDFDVTVETTTTQSAGSRSQAASETGRTISATVGGSGTLVGGMAVASWAP